MLITLWVFIGVEGGSRVRGRDTSATLARDAAGGAVSPRALVTLLSLGVVPRSNWPNA